MSERRAAALRVGGFVIVGVVAILGIVLLLSGHTLEKGTSYETYFQESVEGLDVGTPVKYRGVTIGKITEIGLVSAEYSPPSPDSLSDKVWRQVVVRFEINRRKLGEVPDVYRAVELGLRVQSVPRGITGVSYLELGFVSPADYPAQPVPWTPDTPVIPSRPSTFSQVQDALVHALSGLNKLDLSGVVANLNNLLGSLNQEIEKGDAHAAIGNANLLLQTLNDQIRKADLPATAAGIRNLSNGQQTQQLIAQLNTTTANLAKATAALPQLVAASRSTVGHADEATADLQQQMAPILQNLASTTQNLRDLTATLSRNPGAVLAPAPPKDQP
jgi:ABC-type transporter Mla subunit MlaD